jgi:hypothetical protein
VVLISGGLRGDRQPCGVEQNGEGAERHEDGECGGEEKSCGTSQTEGHEQIRPVMWLAHENLWARYKQWVAAAGARGMVGQGGTVRIGGGGGPAATAGARGRKTPWWLTSGPSVPFNLIHFSKAPTSKFTNMIFLISKNEETFLGDQRDNKEQLSFWDPLPNPSGLHVINSRTNLKLNLP